MSLDSHCFALHVTSLNLTKLADSVCKIDKSLDAQLIHRIYSILRLKENERVILFNETHYALVLLKKISPRELILYFEEIQPHVSLDPSVTWWLPLLKKEAFEQALYTLTEMGAQSIIPIRTQKSSHKWGTSKEYDRARAIMIAAAEQSKQFLIPKLEPVQELLQCKADSEVKVFFDASGKPFIQSLKEQNISTQSIIACSGPEGDLTTDEKNYLKMQGFVFCKLTKTVLRAQQAVALGLGILRTVL